MKKNYENMAIEEILKKEECMTKRASNEINKKIINAIQDNDFLKKTAYQDSTSIGQKIADAIQDDDFSDKQASIIIRMFDGEAVNKNPLIEMPEPEMRLFSVDNNYFESIDELLKYCRANEKSTEGLNIMDYYRNLADCNDVIRKSNSETSILFTVVDRDGYGMYNNERSIYCGKFIWEYHHGSIKNMYKAFRDKGIVFEDDIYIKIKEQDEYILTKCRKREINKK